MVAGNDQHDPGPYEIKDDLLTAPPFGASAPTMIEEIGFALDSPLEESGFELSVPPERKAFPTALVPSCISQRT
jgi:hypothetical protein